MEYRDITFKPVGIVTRGLDPVEKEHLHSIIEFTGEIEVYEEYGEALEGLEEYSHIYIISFLHRAKRRVVTDATRHKGPSRIGAFATRYPGRPNPIGLSLVELVSLNERRITVRGLDLYTGTPILDIKPYDYHSIVCRPRVPRWSYEMWASKRKIYEEYGWPGPFFTKTL